MEWSSHYYAIAQEQQRGLNMIPDRMPTLDNCKEMIEKGEMLMNSLRLLMETTSQQEMHMTDQRMREQEGKGGEYDDDMNGYGDDMDRHESKKQRRGVGPIQFLH
jgi:hypothetical protein